MKYIITLFALFILLSCEETVSDPDLPYKEQLVIAAILDAGKPVNEIYITKTLHPLEEWKEEKAIVTDIIGYIEVDGFRHELKYSGGLYYHTDSLIAEIGNYYELKIFWKGQTVSSLTYVPEQVENISMNIIFTENTEWGDNLYNANIIANFPYERNAVYSGFAKVEVNDEYGKYYWEMNFECLRNKDTLSDGYINLSSSDYWSMASQDTTKYKNDVDGSKYTIYSWASEYYDYYTTRFKGNSDDDIFGTSGNNIKGNIENAIGYFFGRSEVTDIIEFD